MYRTIALVTISIFVSGCSTFHSGIGIETVIERTQSFSEELDIEKGRQPAAQPSFQWPLEEVAFHSLYGTREGRSHRGTDMKASSETPVYASSDGIVVYADSEISGYGKTIIVRHPKNFSTVYAHLSEIIAEEDEYVERGSLIAYSGSTGRASGPHLHFEIREGKKAIEPSLLIQKP